MSTLGGHSRASPYWKRFMIIRGRSARTDHGEVTTTRFPMTKSDRRSKSLLTALLMSSLVSSATTFGTGQYTYHIQSVEDTTVWRPPLSSSQWASMLWLSIPKSGSVTTGVSDTGTCLLNYIYSSRALTCQVVVPPRSSLGQSSALHPFPGNMATLHPSWQACQLLGIICRDSRAQRLVSSNRRPYPNQVQPQEQHMGRHHRSWLARWIEGDPTIHRFTHRHGDRSRRWSTQDAGSFPWSGRMGWFSRSF